MDGLLLLMRLVLCATFAVAGFTKATDPQGTRESLEDFGVPESLVRAAAILLPMAELACALALLPAATALWGAAGTLALLLLFAGAIAVSLARGRRPNCHCFGQLHSAPVGWITIVRNLALSAVAGAVILQAREKASPSFVDWFAGLDRFAGVVVGFAAAFATLAAFAVWSLVHLLRQNGRLLLRLETIETQLGIRPEPPEPGLPVGTPAPPFRVTALDGSIVTLEALQRASGNLLLIFTEPGCGACDALMPQVAEWQRDYAERVSIVPVSRGSLAANRAKATQYGLQNFLLQANEEVSKAYQAEGSPTAVRIRDGRIASSVASGSDAIQGLVSLAIQPPPLAQGEAAPEISLPDLSGAAVPLRGLQGRRHLLLFWNPDCGYCQEMLADIKAWERDRRPDAPQLFVISTGEAEDNRAQGFLAPVVLDRNFRTLQLFGAEGTPSAVMLDEEGRIASSVVVGAQEVLRLARRTHDSLLIKN